MKDKELRKLSRLELLELLLEANNENKLLKEKLSYLTAENESAKSVESLALTARQMDEVLEQATELVAALKATEQKAAPESRYPSKTGNTGRKDSGDKRLYIRIMNFYEKNDGALNELPSDIQKDIRTRLKEVSENRKNNG